ncbi:hypothetical protein GCM10008090_06530 [Arenicella chitinivorans]|uniref:Right handed beta helix domain-containing protein n=1 Tax=Arenicella chitinivorans TaxID=1329800 RepID=A0A918VJ53_9GAMM|nr:right-handed parallel beta-helix repeat-containing protein [Arenicella chitinivorans]GHA00446.1 hypothetical protein GCM10008090_06530 [Arenicella chitinivorans]
MTRTLINIQTLLRPVAWALILATYSLATSTFSRASDVDGDDLLLLVPAIIASGMQTIEACTLQDLTASSAPANIDLVCDINLNGRTVSLPPRTTINAERGRIDNGKLVFERGGYIDGRLLGSSLSIVGTPQLLAPVFQFVPERWQQITQGPTTANKAFRNNQELERLFNLVKSMGGTEFRIGKFDAFFQARMTAPDQFVFRPAKEAVNLPSDFTLRMSNNTHLRVFPATPGSELRGGAILSVRDAQNITVIGGNLHGDRDTRYYSPDDDGLEGSHLFYIRSGRNVTLKGIKFFNGSAGSITVNSFGFSFNPDYNPTDRLVVENCLFSHSRRMSISLTDGRNVKIRGNRFINNGQPSANSDGGEVGYAINIEPARTRDNNGDLLEYQKVIDTEISNNQERGSRGGFVTLTIGQNLTVRNNRIGTRVTTSLVSDSQVVDNVFNAIGEGADSYAIFAAGANSETVFGNLVARNTIQGYASGIISSTRETLIADNKIVDTVVGMQSFRSTSVRFERNQVASSSRGINITNTYNDDLHFEDNTINANSGFHIYVANVNKGASDRDKRISFNNNTTNGDRAVVVSNSVGILLTQNNFNSGVQLSDSSAVTLNSNTIRPKSFDGVRLFGSMADSTVQNNQIYEPTGAERLVCLRNDLAQSQNVLISGNTCSQ